MSPLTLSYDSRALQQQHFTGLLYLLNRWRLYEIYSQGIHDFYCISRWRGASRPSFVLVFEEKKEHPFDLGPPPNESARAYDQSFLEVLFYVCTS